MAALLDCPECDLLQRTIPLAAGQSALCNRCGATLYRGPRPDRVLPFTLAALIAFGAIIAFPIVGLEVGGNVVHTTLPGAARALYDDGMAPLAALVVATTVVCPLAALLSMALLQWRKHPVLLRTLHAVQAWSMVEVFVLGLLVALAKLAHMATVAPGAGAWALGAFVVLWAAAHRATGL